MRLLAVPVRIDALWLPAQRTVAGPVADFTRLPYRDPVTGRDVHPDQPFLSDGILPAPFEEELTLQAGVHLHWALPDALTRLVHSPQEGVLGREREAATQPPRVPDRWLVTRTDPDGRRARWVVESDALTDESPASVAYPLSPADPPGPSGRPWRRLGRVLPLGAWPGPETDRVARLTALGYGEPTFAAFYPNSASVFGFFDPQSGTGRPAGTRYDLLGWYSSPALDELTGTLARPGAGTWAQRLADELGWAAGPEGAAPERMVCFGRLTLAPEGELSLLETRTTETGVYLADSATEALAAHLGAELPGVSADEMEQLLEAIDLADRLETATLDLPERLAEARHTAAFTPVAAGTRWTVRPQDAVPGTDPAALVAAAGPAGSADSARPAPVGAAPARELADLPPELGDLLVALNAAQATHDGARAQATGLRQRLFADWHRYLTCAYPPPENRTDYPDPDLAAAYLQREMAVLDALLAETGEFPATGRGDTLAHRLAAAREAVEAVVARVNAGLPEGAGYRLQQLPDDSYQVPNEPVVLLTGAEATGSDRYGSDDEHPEGLLPCLVVEAPAAVGELTDSEGVAAAGDLLDTVLAGLTEPHPALRRWTGQPWHPLLLHWEVEFLPAAPGTNLDPTDRDYDPEVVSLNYRLPAGEVELTTRPGHRLTERAAVTYSGSTVLSTATRPLLSARILRYLAGGPLARYNEERAAAGLGLLTPEQVTGDPAALLAWCADQSADPRLGTLAAAYAHLAEHEGSNLAQSLGGFNDALLMRRLTRQLPILDPLGFPSGQLLAEQVRERIGEQNRQAPVPLADFNPLRVGCLRLLRLRVVDSFGVGHDLSVDQPAATTRLRVPGRPGWIALPPRVAQPARLRLRLLDAEHPGRPVSGLVESSPVCGWLLPDLLDDGLRVHAAGGEWLGSLLPDPDPDRPALARWLAAPTGGVPAVEQIGDPGLRAVVDRLRGYGADRLGELLGSLLDALEAVDEEGEGGHQVRSRLTGRPVAVLRLAIGLDLLGPPAIHQDWNVFRQDLGRTGRETNGFPLVRFPVRLGAYGRLTDGVLGYWRHEPDGSLGTEYHDVPTMAAAGADPPVRLAFGLPEETLTVLLEPAGALHATTGILPTVSVRLDPAHHHDALARLETGFLAAPVLTDAAGVGVVLPATEPGRRWTWRERAGAVWTETEDPPAPNPGFPTDLTLREGWLALPTPTVPTR
ncbi:hypothetical protein [Micromonospora echinospora]|uniref:hypothetical protein n=1 Tax=Micromonospora echinospora TaxID=1877 RepID=UPI003672E4F4